MRLRFLLLAILFGSAAFAQKLGETTIVKDSSGTVFPFAIWQALLMKGGHTLKPENKSDPATAYFLIRLSDEEKEARLAKMQPPKESRFFRKGEKFNLGKMKDIQGNIINLKENEGKVTVVNFWFINCPPCRMEIPDLNALVEKYKSDSVRFVAVALDSKSELENFLKAMPFQYNIIDDGLSLSQRYGI